MLRLATFTRPATGDLKMDVCTIFPRHSTSRGNPTLTETSFICDAIREPDPASPRQLEIEHRCPAPAPRPNHPLYIVRAAYPAPRAGCRPPGRGSSACG